MVTGIPKMNLLDLFSGIGGFSLGLERSGAFQTVAFCEIDKFCRRVLAKHWPEVPQYGDIGKLTGAELLRDGIRIDAICGGFPCQDISTAGKGAGLAGERSGLWREFARLIGEIRPRYVIVENVSALLFRGIDVVLRDLAALGYDAEWHCIPAWFLGAPHARDRLWIIAHARSEQYQGAGNSIEREATEEFSATALADANNGQRQQQDQKIRSGRHAANGGGKIMGNSIRVGLQRQRKFIDAGHKEAKGKGKTDHAFYERVGREWAIEPAVGRVANGVPNRVDRLKGLGNAVVPQIPELIGRAILEYETSK